MRYAYPIEVLQEADGVTVTAPDVPEMVTTGGTVAEALARAPDALVSALSFYTDEDRPLPYPSRAHGLMAALPVLVAAKLALHEAMLRHSVSNVELGRRMGRSETLIRRLRDPLHRSHIGQVEAALGLFNLQVAADVTDKQTPDFERELAFTWNAA